MALVSPDRAIGLRSAIGAIGDRAIGGHLRSAIAVFFDVQDLENSLYEKNQHSGVTRSMAAEALQSDRTAIGLRSAAISSF